MKNKFKAEQGREFNLTKDQKKTLEAILTSNDGVIVIQGDAGTGMTARDEKIKELKGNVEYCEDKEPEVILNLMSAGYKTFGTGEIVRQEIKRQMQELIEAYKVTLLLSKVFPENKDFKATLLKEKQTIKALRLKLI